MKINRQHTTSKKRSTTLIITVAILILALGYLSFAYATKSAWPFQEATQTNPPNDSNVNYDPPTQEEVDASQDAKNRILEETKKENEKNNQSENNTSENSSKKTVQVGISFADVINNNLEIRAFTPSVISGDGSCTVTVSKSGEKTITKTSPAFIDATSTICEPAYIPTSQLASGVWKVTVTFSSPTHAGSDDIEVTIQ